MPTLTFNYTVSARVSVPNHIAHQKLGGDAALGLPNGFGRGSHHMLPLDSNGRVDVRPGPSHRSLYVGASGGANTFDVAGINAVEGTSLSDEYAAAAWILAQNGAQRIAPFYWGQHPDYAVTELIARRIMQALGSSMPLSVWIHFERGGRYEFSPAPFSGESGYLRHPIVCKAYGSGALPVFTTPLNLAASPENNVVLEELDYGKITDPALPAARIKAALTINQKSRNWLINLCDLSGKDHSFQNVIRFTLRRNRINDSAYDRPHSGTTWDAGGHSDRLQGAFIDSANHFCFLENIFVHSGWRDGYDAVNVDPTGPSQPPSQYSHGLYVQNNGTDMTFRGNAVTYVASQGAKFQYGAHVTENFFFENPHHFYVWGGGEPDSQPGSNYSTVWGNVCVGTRWAPDRGNNMDRSIAYFRGIAHYEQDDYCFHWNNAVLHSSNPNDAADIAAKPQSLSEYSIGYADRLGDQAPWGKGLLYVGNWLDVADENIGIASRDLNDLTFHYWLDDHLSQSRGTATTLDCVDWFRRAMFDHIKFIVGDFLTGLGGLWNTSAAPGTITFAPDSKGEGWRWDARYNWDLLRRPIKGDTVRLGGTEPVVSWENTAPAVLDMGSGARLHIDGGLMDIGELTGSGTITVNDSAELRVGATSGATVAVALDSGGLTVNGTIAGGLSVAATKFAECVVDGGGSLTFGSGDVFRIEGRDARVGFDGASGTATITMDTGSTMAFVSGAGSVSVVKAVYTGLSGLDAYNRPRQVAVTSAFVIRSGVTLDVDVSGLTPGNTYDLVTADSVTGKFDTVNVTGGNGTISYTATNVQISVA